MAGSIGSGSPFKQLDPDQGASARWTDTGVPCEGSSPSKQTEPHQRSDTRWTDTGVTRKTVSRAPSKETAPDQGVESRWTDTGEASETGSPLKETKLQQGAEARRPDTRPQIQKVGLFRLSLPEELLERNESKIPVLLEHGQLFVLCTLSGLEV